MTSTPSQVSAFRLKRHRLAARAHGALADICRDVCGVQSQLMSAAELALWARTSSISQQGIESALWKKRSLVRTSLMRQTLHIIAADDFALFISALKESRLDALMRYMSRFGVRVKDVENLNQSIVELLRSGPISQADLTKKLLPRTSHNIRNYMKVAWGIQLFRAALVEGLICYGPRQGNDTAYIASNRWIPKQKPVPENEAKQELIRRYLSAYGPATPQDFSRWSGIPINQAQKPWQGLNDELAEVSVGSRKLFLLRKDIPQLSAAEIQTPLVRLLPNFDPFLLGHVEKDYLIDKRHYKRVYRNQGWISPVVLLDGKIIGVWALKARRERTFVEIAPFQAFSKTVRLGIDKELGSLAGFLATSIQLKYTHQP